MKIKFIWYHLINILKHLTGSTNSVAVQERLAKQLTTLREKINELKSLRLYLLVSFVKTFYSLFQES